MKLPYYWKFVNHKFESHNCLKLCFINIPVLCSSFFGCESFFESNSPDILTLFKTNFFDSIDSSSFALEYIFPQSKGIL